MLIRKMVYYLITPLLLIVQGIFLRVQRCQCYFTILYYVFDILIIDFSKLGATQMFMLLVLKVCCWVLCCGFFNVLASARWSRRTPVKFFISKW